MTTTSPLSVATADGMRHSRDREVRPQANMRASRTRNFREEDVTRAVRAARKAGCEPDRIEIVGAKVIIVLRPPGQEGELRRPVEPSQDDAERSRWEDVD